MSESFRIIFIHVYALDQNLTTRYKSNYRRKMRALIMILIYFSLIHLVLPTASPPEKRHPHRPNDRGRDSPRYIRRAGGKPVCRRCQE